MAPMATPAGIEQEHEALLQFLYIAPIGIVQARSCGEIVMLNPLSAQLLMPLAPDGQIANLFTALEPMAPQLRSMVGSFTPAHGKVCDALHLQVPPVSPPAGRDGTPQVLSLTLLKLDGDRLMAVLSDVTQVVERERALRRSQAWIDNIVTGLPDYAFASLDAEGRIEAWNPSIGRVTGHGAQAVVGASFTLLCAPPASTGPRAAAAPAASAARLRQADGSGWSLDEGWQLRADGSRYWGSCLIAPLHARRGDLGSESLPSGDGAEPRAYSLILRNAGAFNQIGPPQTDVPAAGAAACAGTCAAHG